MPEIIVLKALNRRWSRLVRNGLALALVIAGAVIGPVAAGGDGTPPTLGNFRDDYDLPGECPRFLANQQAIQAKIRANNESSIFLDWRARCEQLGLAEISAKTAQHDYVSDLDFADLRLDEIPYISCEIYGLSVSFSAWCQALDRKYPELSQAHYLIFHELFYTFMDFPEATPEQIAAARAVPIDRESCRLARYDNGGSHAVFTDRNLILRDGRAICIKVPYNDIYPGFIFDMSETLFRDVDGDGFMDALLLIGTEGGGGSLIMSVLIVVTRRQPGRGALTKVRFHHLWE